MSTAVGRLAPSPTGAQHVGNARTFLLAWLSIRSQGGGLIFRMEDIDSPRIKPWAAQQAIDDLRWLGLDWDEGPDLGGPHAPYTQTARGVLYRDCLDRLKGAEAVYPCTCTRSDVAAAASAPHPGDEGPIYPGLCRSRTAADAKMINGPYCWRFRTDLPFFNEALEFDDIVRGRECCPLSTDLGDFVVEKMDQAPAYQIAVVADDHEMGVTEVVRGDDLVPSTFRQLALYQFFGWTPPQFAHLPLVVGPDGRRLAKRHGDTRLSWLRERGLRPETLVGWLACQSGLIDHCEPVAACELISQFKWSRLPLQQPVFSAVHAETLLADQRRPPC